VGDLTDQNQSGALTSSNIQATLVVRARRERLLFHASSGPDLSSVLSESWARSLMAVERFFFDSRLSWFDNMLNHGGLVALLHHVCRRVRWWQRCIVRHTTCNRLLGLHLVLKCLTKPKKLPAFDEEMHGFSPPVLVDVGVPGTPSVEHIFR
jgi:hypothetical protein